MMEILESIEGPEDVKRLSFRELKELAQEIRDVIINTVCETGGHLAPSLGVVELTIALHYVFDSPRDKIIWDVGHQAYTHKLITGRLNRFSTLRQYKGISGFPKRTESPHDHFGTGHSSTSISAGLGMVMARELKGDNFKVVSVIGDGSMTAGLAFEGLNNAGHLGKPFIVVLNDNEMSISKNVGALSNYLNRMLTGDLYRRLKKETKSLLEIIPMVGDRMSNLATKVEESLKGLILPGLLFEELGFNYVGPIDGHNIEQLIDTFQRIMGTQEPVLVHVITTKGKGYEFSEKDPSCFHGVAPFEVSTGLQRGKGGAPSYSSVFGDSLIDIAGKNKKVVAVVAAMTEGTGLGKFAKRFPERFFDVGIAEPHAVTFSAGLAAEGYIPVVAIYSTFLQRGYDEIIHDVCLQNLPVIFALDRAGLVGDDGPTHHGSFDISFLRHIPNLIVMSPRDKDEFIMMLNFAVSLGKPVAIRYPRGRCVESFEKKPETLDLGKGEVLTEGSTLAIMAIGNMVYPAYKAALRLQSEGVSTTVLNARFVKPLDRDKIIEIVTSSEHIITVEENAVAGGFGSSVLELLSREGISKKNVRVLGIPDRFIEQGAQPILRKDLGLDEEGIYKVARSMISE
jgi:1-deoxy-D-xylulose-5-phosphate synthase